METKIEELTDTLKSTSKDPLLALEQKLDRTVYELFAACYLPHHLVKEDGHGGTEPCPNAPMHGEMCKRFRHKSRCVVVAPAKYAKSTWCSFIQPLTDGVLGLVKGDILLISNTGRLAEHWLSLIKEEIEHNVDLRSNFGNLKGDVWRQDMIKLRTGITIVSLGLNYQIRGTGWAKVICDDMEDDEMVRSEDQREKFEDWFDGALMGRMHPHTRLSITGTFLHPLCKIKKMFENTDGRYTDWDRILFQALDEGGESTWPERWPTDVVLKQRVEMGEKKFLSEKMNAPVFGKDHVFKEEWFKYYDFLPKDLYIVAMVDPSSSKEKEVGAYTVYEVWGKDLLLENYYFIGMTRGRWAKHSKIKAGLDYNQAYHPVVNLFECDAYSKELKVDLVEEAKKRGQYYPYRIISTRKDKIVRAQAVTDLWEKGRVFLPRRGAERLKEEMLMFPFGDYDDCVDPMSGALGFLRRQRVKIKAKKHIHRKELRPNKAGRLV